MNWDFLTGPILADSLKKQTGQTPEEFQKQLRNHIETRSNTLIQSKKEDIFS